MTEADLIHAANAALLGLMRPNFLCCPACGIEVNPRRPGHDGRTGGPRICGVFMYSDAKIVPGCGAVYWIYDDGRTRHMSQQERDKLRAFHDAYDGGEQIREHHDQIVAKLIG